MIYKVVVAIDSDNPVTAADVVERALRRIKAPTWAVVKVLHEGGATAWKPAVPRRLAR